MPDIRSVSPFRCRMWEFHDRLESHVTAESCRAEIESVEKHGQQVPALGRPLHDDPDYDVELIYGARRLFIARYLNRPLLVELREFTDQEAIIAMDIENRHRTDITPYERGLSYARWLRCGHFKTQEDIARALEVSCSHVSRLLKLARLPSALVSAFESPVYICEEWGLYLMDALDDPYRREVTLRAARAIASNPTRPPAREVYRLLIAASIQGRKPKVGTRDRIIRDDKGSSLLRVRHLQNTVSLVVPLERLSGACLEKVCDVVAQILQQSPTSERKCSASQQAARNTSLAGIG